jgi:hypothetical protein
MIAFKKTTRVHVDRNEEIDLGLAVLSVVRKPGVRLSAYDIAAWCGCSKRYIEAEDGRALMKLRARLRELAITPELSDSIHFPLPCHVVRRMKRDRRAAA